jgi:zinc/manganese transport system substrate-binding protein
MKVFFALALLLPAVASAKVNVVSSISTLGSLAKEVGGDRVSVESLSKGYQDPHFVEPKPSLMLTLNKADLLLHVGLELEIGWLPPLVLGSRNAKIQTGEPGNLDCSQAIPVLDVPTTKIDRSMGDIHPEGNPHYWLPPGNAKILAKEIAQRLEQIDSAGKAEYEKNLAAFDAKVDAKEKEWAPLVAKMKGAKVATYHKSWSYVSQWLGMTEIGYVEPKPGIQPDPQHLAQLVRTMQREHVGLLLMEDFYNRSIATRVAQLAGAKLLDLPTDICAEPQIRNWFTLVDVLLHKLNGDAPEEKGAPGKKEDCHL